MKKQILPIFFTILLSLLVIYILYPLNKGAVALVFILFAGLVWLVTTAIRSSKKSKNNEE